MASRSKQKEEARARRIAQEQAAADTARRQRRLRLLGAVLLGAVVVVVIAVVASSQSGSSNGLQTGSAEKQTVSEVQKLLNGIPQSGAVLGNPEAKITLTYYGDLQCPICRDFTLQGGFPQLVANEVRSGKVKVVYKNFQTATPDPKTFQTQQVAALAAGEQQKFWDYAELFYRQQGQEGTDYVTGSFLSGLAGQVPGLNKGTWQSDRNNASLTNQVANDIQTGKQAGVRGTPTLIFTGPKGSAQVPSAVPDYSQLQQTLNTVA
jgi:protein-disulfide isomerase